MSLGRSPTTLPDGWSTQSLSFAADVVMGQSPPGESYNGDGIGTPFFQGKAEFGQMYPTVRKWTTAGNKHAKVGDILLSVRAPVGPTNVANVDCIIGRGLAAIRAKAHMNQSFLLWFLRGFEHEIAAKGTGTTFDSISGDALRNQLINVPPLAEQEKIVEILEEQLSHLDAALASVRAIRTKAERFRRSLLHAAFTGSLSHSDSLKQGVPGEWKSKSIAEIADDGVFVDGDWVESNDQDPTGNVRLTQLADVGVGEFRNRSDRWMRFDQAERLKVTFLKEGDLLIARMPEPLGRCCQFPKLDNPAVTVVDVAILRLDSVQATPRFVMWALNCPKIHDEIEMLSSGTTRRRISRKKLGTIQIPLPPLEEQRRIVDVLEGQISRLDASLAAAEVIEKKASDLRRSLLHAAFTGELTKEWRESAHV
jgi:restriction endonuclease S subunit